MAEESYPKVVEKLLRAPRRGPPRRTRPAPQQSAVGPPRDATGYLVAGCATGRSSHKRVCLVRRRCLGGVSSARRNCGRCEMECLDGRLGGSCRSRERVRACIRMRAMRSSTVVGVSDLFRCELAAPLVLNISPEIVRQLLLEPRFGPTSAKSGRFGSRVGRRWPNADRNRDWMPSALPIAGTIGTVGIKSSDTTCSDALESTVISAMDLLPSPITSSIGPSSRSATDSALPALGNGVHLCSPTPLAFRRRGGLPTPLLRLAVPEALAPLLGI